MDGALVVHVDHLIRHLAIPSEDAVWRVLCKHKTPQSKLDQHAHISLLGSLASAMDLDALAANDACIFRGQHTC